MNNEPNNTQKPCIFSAVVEDIKKFFLGSAVFCGFLVSNQHVLGNRTDFHYVVSMSLAATAVFLALRTIKHSALLRSRHVKESEVAVYAAAGLSFGLLLSLFGGLLAMQIDAAYLKEPSQHHRDTTKVPYFMSNCAVFGLFLYASTILLAVKRMVIDPRIQTQCSFKFSASLET